MGFPFSIDTKEVKNWLVTADERLLAHALETTDPDPFVQRPKLSDAEKKRHESKFAVDLLKHQEVQSQRQPLLFGVAENSEAFVRSLSKEEVFVKLKELEAKAFESNPDKKEVTVKDFEAFLRLKNLVRVAERIASEDPDYFSKAERSIIARFSIFLSPELGPKDRELIYAISRENLDPKSFLLSIAARYDGIPKSKVEIEHRNRTAMKLFEYAKNTWSHDEIALANQALADSFVFNDLAEMAARIAFSVNFLRVFDDSEIISTPMSWDQVREKGEVIMTLDAYPVTPGHWLDDEMEVMKRIHYQGVPIYELLRFGVETIELYSYSSDPEEESLHSWGEASYDERRIRVSHSEDAQSTPMHKRLSVMTHELFHMLQAHMGNHFGREIQQFVDHRDVYFFAAYVAEEYLKLRLENRNEKPIADEEIKEMVDFIAYQRLNGLAANALISLVDPKWKLNDLRIEIPEVERQRLNKKVRALRKGSNFFNIFDKLYPAAFLSLYNRLNAAKNPTQAERKEIFDAFLDWFLADAKRAVREVETLTAKEALKLCDTIPGLKEAWSQCK